MIELQDILLKYGNEFLRTHKLSLVQEKAYRAITTCRTSALGAHIYTCDTCGYEKISYNSCRNRHCPKCQTFAKEQWIAKQNQNLLDVQYFHVVFTVPDSLNPLIYQNQETLYRIFFKAMSETLLELGGDEKYLGAKIGCTSVLHTWGQNLLFHPHIHCIVPGGGLTKDKKWVCCRKKFFIPVKVLSKKFKGKFMFYLRQACSNPGLDFYGTVIHLKNPRELETFIFNLYQKNWIVYCKPPFKNASKVVEYLGRYTHRVAISNNRIIKLENNMVTFKWRDYKDSNKNKIMSITVGEFIRRFMMHILPTGFCKIRHYGILASCNKTDRLNLCKKLTNTKISMLSIATAIERLQKIFGNDFNLCPCCGKGHLARGSPTSQTT